MQKKFLRHLIFRGGDDLSRYKARWAALKSAVSAGEAVESTSVGQDDGSAPSNDWYIHIAPDTGWVNANNQLIAKVNNYHNLEDASTNVKKEETVVNGKNYIRYGPIDLRYGTAKISEFTLDSKSKDVSVQVGNSSGPKTGTNLEILNEDKKQDGAFTYGKEKSSYFYLWIDPDTIPDNIENIKITIKQEEYKEFKEGIVAALKGGDENNENGNGDNRGGQPSQSFSSTPINIPGGEVTINIPVEAAKGKIIFQKRDSLNKEAPVNITFIVNVNNKGFIDKNSSGTNWKYTSNADNAKVFSTTNGNYTIEKLPVGSKVTIYEKAIGENADDYRISDQDGKRKIVSHYYWNPVSGSTTKDGTTITMYNKKHTKKLTVKKVWTDTAKDVAEANLGYRHREIKVELYATYESDGTTKKIGESKITGNNEASFEDLAISKGGKEIKYEVKEVSILDKNGNFIPIAEAGVNYTQKMKETEEGWYITITNDAEPLEEKVNIDVIKKWKGNTSGINTAVTIHVKANGTDISGSPFILSGNGSRKSFTNLPKKDKNGNNINYTVSEDRNDNLYELVSNRSSSATSGNVTTYTYTLTNKVKVEEPPNAMVTIKKVRW